MPFVNRVDYDVNKITMRMVVHGVTLPADVVDLLARSGRAQPVIRIQQLTDSALVAAGLGGIIGGAIGGALMASAASVATADVEFDVVKYQSSFAINEIPRATVIVPVGRLGQDVRHSAMIHHVFKTMREKLQASVYMKVDDASPLAQFFRLIGVPKWPTGEFRIFDGDTVGVAPTRSESASVAIGLEHWLARLAYSSVLSQSLNPRSPFDLLFPASMSFNETRVGLQAQGDQRGQTGTTVAASYVTIDTLLNDLWGGTDRFTDVGRRRPARLQGNDLVTALIEVLQATGAPRAAVVAAATQAAAMTANPANAARTTMLVLLSSGSPLAEATAGALGVYILVAVVPLRQARIDILNVVDALLADLGIAAEVRTAYSAMLSEVLAEIAGVDGGIVDDPNDLELIGGGDLTPFGLAVSRSKLTEAVRRVLSAVDQFGGEKRRDGIQQFLLYLAGRDIMGIDPLTQLTDLDVRFQPDASNGPAAAALRRIAPIRPHPHYQPLKIREDARVIDRQTVASKIAEALGFVVQESLFGTTVWDKIIEMGNEYMFSIVPTVETAFVAPIVPGYRVPLLTIRGDEYTQYKLAVDTPRTIRGVAIYGGVTHITGGILPVNPQVQAGQAGPGVPGGNQFRNFGIGGWYQGSESGQVLFKRAPRWMSSYALFRTVGATTGQGGVQRIPNALRPGRNLPAGVDQGADPDRSRRQAVALMDALAQAMYVAESLVHRQGEIHGRLRFDIAPGSTVRIEVPGEQFLNQDALGDWIYATVIRVDHFIDSQGGRAGTTFGLAHIRNHDENQKNSFSIDRHPLWEDTWKGTSLI